MKHVDITEIVSATPVTIQMTRRERLQHWAAAVRRSPLGVLSLYHGLEYVARDQLRCHKISAADCSAFGVACADTTLQTQGLERETTIGGIMDFFQITQSQLHEFACDCGGSISNKEQADRIEHLAAS